MSGDAAQQLTIWFDKLWREAYVLDLATVSKLREETDAERAEYSLRWKKVAKPLLPHNPQAKLVELFETANGFFLCNTNRKFDPVAERAMHERRYAAAWERFNFSSHMERVKPGDAILAYAKGVGVIGIGRAEDRPEVLGSASSDRIRPGNTSEWRVPITWLAWTEDEGAYQEWKSPNVSFFDVSQDSDLISGIKKHFGVAVAK